MSNKKLGYVPIYRAVQEHWIWKTDTPFDERSAWIDLILMVNHEEKKKKIGSQVITIHAGQKWTSYVKLAERWHWSKKRVMRYLSLLKSDGMITTDSTAHGTMITLVNYRSFALRGNTHDTAGDTAHDTAGVTAGVPTGVTQTIMNKNINNDKEVKKRTPRPPRGGGQWQ